MDEDQTPEFIAERGFTYRDEGLVNGKFKSVFVRWDGLEFVNLCDSNGKVRFASDVNFFEEIARKNPAIPAEHLRR